MSDSLELKALIEKAGEDTKALLADIKNIRYLLGLDWIEDETIMKGLENEKDSKKTK